MKIIEKKTSYGRLRKRVFTLNDEPSLADQSFQEECDVNNIVAKFTKTGQFTHLSQKQAIYADVSDFGDLHDSVQKIQKMTEAFNDLPSELRKKLNNDPMNLIPFLNDPSNDDVAILYGLKERKRNSPITSENEQPKGVSPKGPKSKKSDNATNNDESNDDE